MSHFDGTFHETESNTVKWDKGKRQLKGLYIYIKKKKKKMTNTVIIDGFTTIMSMKALNIVRLMDQQWFSASGAATQNLRKRNLWISRFWRTK